MSSRRCSSVFLLLVFLLFRPLLAATAAPTSAEALIANPSFEQGPAAAPSGWTLKGEGTWGTDDGVDGTRFITVGADGTWQSDPLAFAPGATYELRYHRRLRPSTDAGQSYAVVGPAFAIRVVPLTPATGPPQWHEDALRFTAPTTVAPDAWRITLGQWQLKGVLDYDAVTLREVRLAHRVVGDVTLGMGESISGHSYRFVAPLQTWRTVSRPLAGYSGQFHDNRWRFAYADANVVYRHQVGHRRQVSATVTPDVWFHEESSWQLAVEASADGTDYRTLGLVRHGVPAGTFDIPGDMLPAETIWVRLRADVSDNSIPVFFQCREYNYVAEITGEPMDVVGDTEPLTILAEDEDCSVEPLARDAAADSLAIRIRNGRTRPLKLSPVLTVTAETGPSQAFPAPAQEIPGGAVAVIRMPYRVGPPGNYRLALALGGESMTRLASERRVSVLQASDFGESLPSPAPGVDVWWASAGRKVSRERLPPTTQGRAVSLRLAANEAEAAQLVLRSATGLRGLTVASSGPLRTTGGQVLPASALCVLRVGYVRVDATSDELGCIGWWPDPLPPFSEEGVDVPPDANQPVWIRVTAPTGTPAGIYHGTVAVRAEGLAVDVPLDVEVYGFSLPDDSACRSLFGFNAGQVIRYHNLKTERDQRTVIAKYLQSFADHRISPYNPAPLDPFTYDLGAGLPWDGGRFVKDGVHTGKSALMVADASTTSNPGAVYRDILRLPEAGVEIDFWYRTESAVEPAALYLCHFDGEEQWQSGRNLHVELPPATEWRRFSATLTEFPAGAAHIRPQFHGCAWSDSGDRTSCVWIDDLSIRAPGGGDEMISDGGFEADTSALEPAAITFNWEAWDGAMERAVQTYHFNSFVFSVPGLGGGTFHSRYDGSLRGFAAGTPEYVVLLRGWCAAAREHLEEKGLLDKAVVYPFDEPAEKDYPFVVEQLRKLKENFPGLRRMVPMDLRGGPAFVGVLDYWCPIMNTHSPAFAAARREAGDAYGWYICCAPKAPYIANFIDRPATDMRVWLWQTWQEKVDHVLIWETVWWTSGAAYPDSPQNPYLDSMSWVDGYGTPRGEKRRWNVGDGRFLYPPETATGLQDEAILDGPVSSIRWEALRDGVEDFEYLSMLRSLLQTQSSVADAATAARYADLLAVPPSVSTSLVVYTREPEPIETHREALARAIEDLSRR